MQEYYYQNNAPNYYPQAPQYPPKPSPPVLTPKQYERRLLRKTANKLGLFVLIYFVVMTQVFTVINKLLSNMNVYSRENLMVYNFLLQITASVASVLAAALFYKLISRQRLGDCIPKERVRAELLIPIVLLGLGVAMIANQLALLFDTNISIFSLENTANGSPSTRSTFEIILYIVSTAIVPAFAEEFAFRGILMGSLRKYGDTTAILISSVLFGAMHGNTTQIIFAFVLGLIFAYVDCKTNSIIPSILIHFANNFYAVATGVLSSNSGFDDVTVTMIQLGLIIIICLAGLLSYIYLACRYKGFFSLREGEPNGIAPVSELTLKEKLTAGFTTVGVIISLSVFAAEMILNLIPESVQQTLLNGLQR